MVLPENYLEEANKANSIEIARMNIKLCRDNKKLVETLKFYADTDNFSTDHDFKLYEKDQNQYATNDVDLGSKAISTLIELGII